MNELTTQQGQRQPPEPTNLFPIKDDTPAVFSGLDHVGPKGFNLSRLERMVADCDSQPLWRERADLAAAFVDGKQFTPEQEAALVSEGLMDLRPTNLVARTVRAICGQEAKSRTDIKVEADDDEESDVCDVLNQAMKESQREAYADMAISAAYFGQVGPGIGWVEVGEATDPLDWPDAVKDVHRSEIWWDWRAKDMLLRDARWLARKRWADLDELEAAMPWAREILRMCSNGWSGFMFDQTQDETMIRRWEQDGRWSQYQRRSEWYDSARKRVKLYEVWYKVPAWAVVMKLGPSRNILFDQRNQSHIQAVATGRVPVFKQQTMQVRMALYAGPHRMQDFGTTRRNFPYVPFFAYRDDEDLSPYGIVEGMISPQMEYNARRARINWMLRARQIFMDNDALDTNVNTLADIAGAVMRPDLTVVLNAMRTNKDANAFRIGTDIQLQKEQVEVMQDSKQLLQDVPGVYGSQLGQAASGVTSGIANSVLIEQGNVSMGDLNDNYRHSRRMVFELLLENIVRRYSQSNLQVLIGRGSTRRAIVLNAFDPQQGKIINNVADAPTRVGLGEIPSTPAFKMQQQQQTATIIESLAKVNPQAASVLIPGFIEATDQPDRMERADDVRRFMGLPTSGDKQASAKIEKQQADQKAKQDQVQQAVQTLGMEKEAATIEKIKSETELNNTKATEIGHTMGTASLQAAAEPAAPAEDPKARRQRLIDESLASALQKHGR